MEQLLLTKTGENQIDINSTGMDHNEIVFTLAATLVGYCKELGLTEAILNESMSTLWKDGEQMRCNWKRVINKVSGIAIMILVAKAIVSYFVYGNDITSSDLVYFLSCSFILGLGLYLGGSSV